VEDFAKRIPNLLESMTRRIRAITVDPLARVIKYATLGLVATALVVVAVIFLLVGIFRIIEELIDRLYDSDYSMEIAYGIVGGVFLLLGALFWSRKTRKTPPEDGTT